MPPLILMAVYCVCIKVLVHGTGPIVHTVQWRCTCPNCTKAPEQYTNSSSRQHTKREVERLLRFLEDKQKDRRKVFALQLYGTDISEDEVLYFSWALYFINIYILYFHNDWLGFFEALNKVYCTGQMWQHHVQCESPLFSLCKWNLATYWEHWFLPMIKSHNQWDTFT